MILHWLIPLQSVLSPAGRTAHGLLGLVKDTAGMGRKKRQASPRMYYLFMILHTTWPILKKWGTSNRKIIKSLWIIYWVKHTTNFRIGDDEMRFCRTNRHDNRHVDAGQWTRGRAGTQVYYDKGGKIWVWKISKNAKSSSLVSFRLCFTAVLNVRTEQRYSHRQNS